MPEGERSEILQIPVQPGRETEAVLRRQFLGDSRDAFKWDFLRYVVTKAVPAFEKLVYVPMLTADDKDSTFGRTDARTFPAVSIEARDFAARLAASKDEVGVLGRVTELGSIGVGSSFPVDVHEPDELMGSGFKRARYWTRLLPKIARSTVVFADPDNGLETETLSGPAHLRVAELEAVVSLLPENSLFAFYQHRPREEWNPLLDRFRDGIRRGPRPELRGAVARCTAVAIVLLFSPGEQDRVGSVLRGYEAEVKEAASGSSRKGRGGPAVFVDAW